MADSTLEDQVLSLSNSEELEQETIDTSSEEGDSAVITVRTADIVSALSSATINLFLPFINGMMLGFGEIFAHELGYKWGFTGARVVDRKRKDRQVETDREN